MWYEGKNTFDIGHGEWPWDPRLENMGNMACSLLLKACCDSGKFHQFVCVEIMMKAFLLVILGLFFILFLFFILWGF